MAQPFPAGTVEWSGENPGMYLKETEDGPFVSLVSFFRVVVSPHGPGVGAVVLEAPGEAASRPDALNVCVTDNEPLLRWLVENYAAHFGPFRGQSALGAIEYRHLQSITTRNELPRAYTEQLGGDGVELTLAWGGLGEPFAVDLAPEHSATGSHEMLSLFVESGEPVATVNGRRLPGRSMPRNFAGRTSTTAFLAFSETWIRP